MRMNIVEKRSVWFWVSGIMVGASLLAVALWGLRFGIDFTGGSLTEVHVASGPEAAVVRTTLEEQGFAGVSVQGSDDSLLVRTTTLSEEEHAKLLETLTTSFGETEELRFDSIGPVIGKELQQGAIWAVFVTLLLIGLYIAFAFRKVSEPVASWKYGALTIFAAFHDVLITIGAFAVLGTFLGWEIGTTFVAAILTILGYSINDTVVVFDRTRENLKLGVGKTFAETVEISIRQTFTRSVFTSVTTLLALVAIFLFGGETTRSFALALIVGITVGSYSSIFLASTLLVSWESWRTKRGR